MFGAGSLGGMLVFAILYGVFSGGFISLISPAFASFSTSQDEVGTRMGIALFVMGFALLTGTPITGALLQPPQYEWFKAIIFSGVRLFFPIVHSSSKCLLNLPVCFLYSFDRSSFSRGQVCLSPRAR